MFKTLSAAVALITLIGSGIFVNQFGNTGSAVATVTPIPWVLASLPKTDSIASVWLSDGSIIEFAKSSGTVSTEVLGWLKTAKPVSVELPQVQQQGITMGTIGPVSVALQTKNQSVFSIAPVYYLIDQKDAHGNYENRYLTNIVELNDGETTTFFNSPPLYQWLMQDGWTSEFTPRSTR